MATESRVLIIEDNDALRVMLFTVLRHQPLSVDTAANLSDAMEKLRSCDYALLLIDMDLPGNNAGELLNAFREERPDAPTFVIAVRDPRKDTFIDPEIVSAILNKPLEIDTLAEVVRECALVVPPPEDPLQCPPADSDVTAQLYRTDSILN